jgi:sugar lactone lactonase YvrE
MTATARVLFEGIFSEPRLDHPEGVAVHPDGSVWCGGERGQIYRVDPDAGSIEQVASTDGFCLGMAFDAAGDLFVCDLRHAAVMRVETATGRVERFATHAGGHEIRVPNYPAFDADGRLYVSDSHGDDPGPGILRFDPDGAGVVWYGEPLHFANGIALDPAGRHLYVAETWRNAVSRIAIGEDGEAGAHEDVALLPGVLPDGLAVGGDGSVYVGCYEPSQVLRITGSGSVELVFADPTAHLLCHPTNLAFRGDSMITSNLGRWHLTEIELGARGVALPPGRDDR